MKKDKFKIDSHKLIYHPERVVDWMNNKNIYPIYMEISPVGSCNHRCEFCSVDFMGYQNRKLDTDILKKRLAELGELGLKSIMYAGEGEPFIHRDMAKIAEYAKQSGIDVAFTTNGVLMDPKTIERIIPITEWIKVSCNAGTPESYSKIHRTKIEDFNRVIENLKYAVKLKQTINSKCTIGMQIVLLPNNIKDVKRLAKIASDIGIDYLVVKPYMPHRDNAHNYDIEYGKLQELENELMEYNSKSFSVIYRANAMNKWDEGEKTYSNCLALPFWSYIDSGGNVWGCSVYLDEDEFFYGNINESSFQEIWEGKRRQQSLKFVEECLDISKCKLSCRMDEINRYLWDLKIPPKHVNFI